MYDQQARYAPGACPTSMLLSWKSCSVFHRVIVVPLIRSLTVSVTAPLNMTCCRGVGSTACRSWRIRPWVAPAPDYYAMLPLPVLPQHTVAPQPLLHWPGPSAAVRSLQFPRPVP